MAATVLCSTRTRRNKCKKRSRKQLNEFATGLSKLSCKYRQSTALELPFLPNSPIYEMSCFYSCSEEQPRLDEIAEAEKYARIISQLK